MEKLPPQGAMVELNLESIDSGAFVEEINKHLREAIRVIDQAGGGKVVIKPAITIARVKKSNTGVEVVATIAVTKPTTARVEIGQVVGGKILTDFRPADEDRHQMPMFDRFGRPSGLVDTRTGEVVEPAANQDAPIAKVGG